MELEDLNLDDLLSDSSPEERKLMAEPPPPKPTKWKRKSKPKFPPPPPPVHEKEKVPVHIADWYALRCYGADKIIRRRKDYGLDLEQLEWLRNPLKSEEDKPTAWINPQYIYNLALQGNSEEDICHLACCSPETMRNYFSFLVQKGHAQLRASLRKSQLETASRGSAPMQIWLGKQLLRQQDKVSLELQRASEAPSLGEYLDKYNLRGDNVEEGKFLPPVDAVETPKKNFNQEAKEKLMVELQKYKEINTSK